MLISLIVLNHNGADVLTECLSSLVGQDFPKERYEIIVVDNASSDRSADLVSEYFTSPRVVRSGVNRGYAGGANLGARYAAGDVLVFLNNDVKLSREWLSQMVLALEEEGSAIVGSKVFLKDPPGRLNHAGGLISYLGTGYDIGFGLRDHTPERKFYTGYVSGAALMIPKQLFRALGGFDESYLLYCEDVDLCWRAWLGGYKVLVQPKATAMHRLQSARSPAGYWMRLFNWHKNGAMNVLKNFETAQVLRGLLLHLILQGARVMSAIRWASPWRIIVILKVDVRLLRNLRSVVVKRLLVQSSRKRSDRELRELGVFMPVSKTVISARSMFLMRET